jgi:hypothetical protein
MGRLSATLGVNLQRDNMLLLTSECRIAFVIDLHSSSNASPSESGSHHNLQEEVDELSAAEIELIKEKKKKEEVEFVANPELDTSMSIDFDGIWKKVEVEGDRDSKSDINYDG